jgi:hypothetical protein
MLASMSFFHPSLKFSTKEVLAFDYTPTCAVLFLKSIILPHSTKFLDQCTWEGEVHLSLKTKNHVRSQHTLKTPYIQFLKFLTFVKSSNAHTISMMKYK